MGLDNGIFVYSRTRKLSRKDLPFGMTYPFETEDSDEDGVEICYWRKCWGLRNDIVHCFGSGDKYSTLIEAPEQVMCLIEIIASWLDEKKWNAEGGSLWSYEQIRHTLIVDIVNLGIMYNFMQSNSDIYLEFYDSF